MKLIKLKNYIISENSYPYIIAEVGINHNGDINIAKRLIYEAKKNGANAVKFQKRNIEKTFTKAHLDKDYNKSYSFGKTYREHKQYLEFSDEQYIELYEYAKFLNIDFLCSGFDITAFDFINDLVEIHKIASPFINDYTLLEHVANYGKPIILSTGMHSLEEIENAINIIKPINDNIILMQCTTSYPVKDKDVNLNVLHTFKNKFNTLVGYSSHDEGIIIPTAAIAQGACVIEKHFTIDKNMIGPDHKASIIPTELRQLRINCDRIYDALGSFNKIPTEDELIAKEKYGVSWVSSNYIYKGDILNEDNLCIKCPGNGISPIEDIYGKIVNKDIDIDTVITKNDIL